MTFPTDDVTLGMLEAACIGDDEGSHLMDMLGFGSVDMGTYVHHDPETGDRIEFQTRAGGYHPNDVILALVDEVRTLRNANHPPARWTNWRGVGVPLGWVRNHPRRGGDRGLDNGARKRWPWSRENGSTPPPGEQT